MWVKCHVNVLEYDYQFLWPLSFGSSGKELRWDVRGYRFNYSISKEKKVTYQKEGKKEQT